MTTYKKLESNGKNELLIFLRQIDSFFPIPLSRKQNLENLGDKLLVNGVVIGAYYKGRIIGMVGGYTNDLQNKRAYISVLCVLPEFQGKSIAKTLIAKFVQECSAEGMKSIFLYTHKTNIAAQRLYKKLGFKEEIDKNRPEDILYTLLL